LPRRNTDYRYSYGREIGPKGELDRGAHLPEDLIQLDSTGKWDSHSLRRGIRILLSLSLSGRYFSMHRLVHGWAYDCLTLEDKMDHILAAKALLAGSFTEREESEDYKHRRYLLPHITACEE
jgi:hypothetical protein